MLPTAAVEGVGAVDEPVPPVAVVYHNKPLPVAVSGEAVWFWQSCTGVFTTGAAGMGLTVTVTGTLALSQLFATVWLTYQVNVPGADVEGIGAEVLPPVRAGLLYQVSVLLPLAVAFKGEAMLLRQ